MAPYV
ncbi:hypothetical protein VCHC47A1_2175, partial [Vibrio cholerae HC-47A1]